MSTYSVRLSRRALKDWEHIQTLKRNNTLRLKTNNLYDMLHKNPWEVPPTLKKLVGDLSGCVARRLNKKERFVYRVIEEEKVVFVLQMLRHYEDNG